MIQHPEDRGEAYQNARQSSRKFTEAFARLPPISILPPLVDRPESRTLEVIQRMADSFRDIGQLQPCRVLKEGSQTRMIAGETRRRAALLLGWEFIDCIVVEGEISKTDEAIWALEENNTRSDFSILEKGKICLHLMIDNKWTQMELAAAAHMTQGEVAKALAILKNLAADLYDDVHSGTIPVNSAYQLSRLPDQAQQVALAQDGLSGRLPWKAIEAQIVAELSRQKDKDKPKPKSLKGKMDGRPVELGLLPNETTEGLIEWLKATATKLGKFKDVPPEDLGFLFS